MGLMVSRQLTQNIEEESLMNRMLKAYKLKESDTIVTQKSLIKGTKDTDFTEVRLIISMDEIKEWAEEIEMLGLGDEEDF